MSAILKIRRNSQLKFAARIFFFEMNLRLHVFFGQFLWLIAVLNGKTFQGIPGYGRNLVIKTLPAIEDYQSNVYEVYMEPYLYVSVNYKAFLLLNGLGCYLSMSHP